MLKKFEHFQHLAELYHVYHSIQRFMVRPAAAIDPNVSHSEISEKNYLKVASTQLSCDFNSFHFITGRFSNQRLLLNYIKTESVLCFMSPDCNVI